METLEDLIARDPVRRGVIDLFAIAMRACRNAYPHETKHTWAQYAIRDIVRHLYELAGDHELSGDLQAALSAIGEGSEPFLPDDERRLWEQPRFGRKRQTPSGDSSDEAANLPS